MSKIDKTVALSEFERWADAMDLDIDLDGATEENIETFDGHKSKIVGAIMKGSMVINEQGEAVYTTQRGDEPTTIVFREADGASLMAMDKGKKDENISALYGSMASITGQHKFLFTKMKMTDLKICIAVTTLFLAL